MSSTKVRMGTQVMMKRLFAAALIAFAPMSFAAEEAASTESDLRVVEANSLTELLRNVEQRRVV